MGPSRRHCPTCGRVPAPVPANGAWPFCSDRCRLADLGRWLGESYRIPGDPAGDGGVAPRDDDEEGTT